MAEHMPHSLPSPRRQAKNITLPARFRAPAGETNLALHAPHPARLESRPRSALGTTLRGFASYRQGWPALCVMNPETGIFRRGARHFGHFRIRMRWHRARRRIRDFHQRGADAGFGAPVTCGGKAWGLPAPARKGIDWEGNEWAPESVQKVRRIRIHASPRRPRNARWSIDPDWQNPEGVPLSADSVFTAARRPGSTIPAG